MQSGKLHHRPPSAGMGSRGNKDFSQTPSSHQQHVGDGLDRGDCSSGAGCSSKHACGAAAAAQTVTPAACGRAPYDQPYVRRIWLAWDTAFSIVGIFNCVVATDRIQGVVPGPEFAPLSRLRYLAAALLTAQLVWISWRPHTLTWNRRMWCYAVHRAVRLVFFFRLGSHPSFHRNTPLILLNIAEKFGTASLWPALRALVGFSLAAAACSVMLVCPLPLWWSLSFQSLTVLAAMQTTPHVAASLQLPALVPGVTRMRKWACTVVSWLVCASANITPMAQRVVHYNTSVPITASDAGVGLQQHLCRVIDARWLVIFFQIYIGVVLPAYVLHSPAGYDGMLLNAAHNGSQRRPRSPQWLRHALSSLLFMHVPAVLLLGVALAMALVLVLGLVDPPTY